MLLLHYMPFACVMGGLRDYPQNIMSGADAGVVYLGCTSCFCFQFLAAAFGPEHPGKCTGGRIGV